MRNFKHSTRPRPQPLETAQRIALLLEQFSSNEFYRIIDTIVRARERREEERQRGKQQREEMRIERLTESLLARRRRGFANLVARGI